MKRIISMTLVALMLLSLALAMTACGGNDTAVCFICDKECKKSEMDSGKLEDEIIYICDDCLIPADSQTPSQDDHDGHDHAH